MSSANTTSLSSVLLPIQRNILFSISWIYVTFGLGGCLLNILLFSRKQLLTISCCTYFLVASVAMFIQLVIYSVPTIYAYFYPNPVTYIISYCKIRTYLVQVTSLAYRWAYTAASFDRYALSSVSVRLRRLARVKIALCVLAGILLFWMVFSAYLLFVFEIRSSTCNIFNNPVVSLFTSISTIVTGNVMPITIMIICTLLIRRNLAEKRQRRHILTNQQEAANRGGHLQRKRDQQALRMLFVQIIVFIIINTPWIIYNINNLVSLFIPDKSADRIAIEGFITAVAGSLAFLFPAVSFYVYTLTSSIFRDELRSIVRVVFCGKCLTNNHRVEPTTANGPQRVPLHKQRTNEQQITHPNKSLT